MCSLLLSPSCLLIMSCSYNENTTESPLLHLPPEIRNRILSLILGEKNIHVGLRGRKSVACLCHHSIGETQQRAGKIRAIKESRKLEVYIDQHSDCFAVATRLSIVVSVLQVCRQIHHEAALLPFATNLFSFPSFPAFEGFIGTLLLEQAKVLRDVVITSSFGFSNYTPLRKSTMISIPAKSKGLQNLTVLYEIDEPAHSKDTTLTHLMNPLRAFSGVVQSKVEIVISSGSTILKFRAKSLTRGQLRLRNSCRSRRRLRDERERRRLRESG
jgi:hypothetical protein